MKIKPAVIRIEMTEYECTCLHDALNFVLENIDDECHGGTTWKRVQDFQKLLGRI